MVVVEGEWMVGMLLVGTLLATTTRHCGGSGSRGDGWDGVNWHSFANNYTAL